MDSPRRLLPPSPSPPHPSSSSRPLDLEVTVVSANHLKNVNWRNGDLKPYVVVYLDPDRRVASKPDDAGSTRPVWNERLALPLPSAETLLFLTLDVFHSKPSETPKPLVGTARSPLKDLLHQDAFAGYATGRGGGAPPSPVRTLELRRPSGRPQGKIRIRLAIRERPCPPPEPRPGYHFPPPPHSSGYYYPSNAPPFPSPPPPHSARDYRNFSPPPPPIPPYGHPIPSHPLDHRPRGSKIGAATGLAVGAVAGALGGLALEEGLRYEEEKITERAESSFSARDDYYSDHRADY
ncbi:C2 domain [Musa troglodytarum]|uniref:C2 domain n=1 Tax=Musa troglodytarum TaxID=320322 RepID=A0A9E7K729_9LILI|nr:C2 domain [Musa troglodytarum]